MSGADDWAPVKQTAADDDWQPVGLAERPAPTVGDALPEAFLDRVRQGADMSKTLGHAEGRGVVDKLFGLTGERYQLWPEKMLRSGFTLAHDVASGELQTQVIDPISGEITLNPEMIQRSMDMASFQLGQTHISPTVPRSTPAPLINAGSGQFVRPFVGEDGALSGKTVGGLPTPDDFSNAAKVLAPPKSGDIRFYHGTVYDDASSFHGSTFVTPHYDYAKNYHGNNNNVLYTDMSKAEAIRRGLYDEINDYAQHGPIDDGASMLKPMVVEQNLRRMWQEDGIHPAEAVHDAEGDAFLKHDITAPQVQFFHGSPADFVEFDNSKIGSGEGAQSFAYGHYLAESSGVAEGYAKKLGVDGKGNVYTARITPDRDSFLQWEADLEDQPAGRAVLSRMDSAFKEKLDEFLEENNQPPLDTLTGGMLHRTLERYAEESELPGIKNEGHPKREASEYLSSLDVPGVSFLDKKSRGMRSRFGDLDAAPKGENPTRNFVVFDANHIEITHKNGEPVQALPESWGVRPEEMEQAFGEGASLSAAVTPPEEIPIAVQPASPPGSLAASFQAAADKLFDLGRDVQMKLAPMATGTRESMAMVKDYANAMRRNRWDWSRIDTDIAKRFSPEARARMWGAADEESVSRQLGEPGHMREHQGLATLEPAERALVEDLHERAQNAWVRARDAGMVEGEGLPAYTPRMVVNAVSASSKEGSLPLNSIGRDMKTRTGNMLKRKYTEAQETEAAAKAKYGDAAMLARDIRVLPLAVGQLEDAIAGRTLINNIKAYGERTGADTVAEGVIPAGSDTKWFTLDHPAFKTWRPKMETVDGVVRPIKDSAGELVFEQVPLYVHGDFEGPLRAVLSGKSGPLYQGMMALKGKTMSLIMNSPLIHNAVEFGRAFPAMPTRIVKAYFDGNRAKNNVPLMHEAIDAGLVPIGKRFFNQDVNSIMESPDLTPGRSWTAKLLAAVPGLFDEAAGTAVKRAIDKAGDFWHNTLLWDRIADMQMGLYTNFRSDMIAKGIDQQTASRVAAHWANRYAGALPKEAMSEGATKAANLLLFSRTFTMGNIGVLKDMFTGLPRDVLAQIERDAGTIDPKALGYAKSMARRKAIATVVMDVGLAYAANAIVQSAFNVMLGDRTLSEEAHGYVKRVRDQLNEGNVNPLSLLLHASPTSENEPGKQDRVYIGNGKDGTAIYARNPVGKIGEEFTGYLSGPLDMLRRKEGTIARPLLQIYSNDKGFGRKIYDPDADTPARYAGNIWNIVKHVAASQLPAGQIGAFSDLVKGEGDPKINALQAFGPIAGVTFAKGAPGGMDVGEMYHAKTQHDYAVNQAMPDIRRQILRGDLPGAQTAMDQLGIDKGYQRWITKTTLNPRTRMGSKTMRDFYNYSTPEQKRRMEGYLDRFGPQ